MAEEGNLLSDELLAILFAMVRDYKRGRLTNPTAPRPGSRRQQPGRPPIRVILLEDLPRDGQAEAALTARETTTEIQQVKLRGRVISGTFKLTFEGETTENIQYDATADELRDALLALDAFGEADLEVSKPAPGFWLVSFVGKYLTQDDIELMTATATFEEDLDDLKGPVVTVTERTIWEDTGETETVHEMLEVYDPTPLNQGSIALGQWYPGIGYGVHAAKPLDFSLY